MIRMGMWLLVLSIAQTTWAQSGDKVDIQNLEQKYWSAKDDDFSVVQNRRYSKAQRFHVSYFYGTLINDPFAIGNLGTLQVGYYIDERWGFDIAYTTADLRSNETTNQFINQYGVAPNHAFYKSSTIASANFVPLYAKMSLLDKTIIYFDMGVSLGFGMLDYQIQKEEGPESKSAPVFSVGVHQQIFFSENWAVKVELLNKFSQQKQMKYDSSATNRDLGNKSINDTSLHIGLTRWF